MDKKINTFIEAWAKDYSLKHPSNDSKEFCRGIEIGMKLMHMKMTKLTKKNILKNV